MRTASRFVSLCVALPLAGCGAQFALPAGPAQNGRLPARILVDLPPLLRPAVQIAVDEVNKERYTEFERIYVVAEDIGNGTVLEQKAKLRAALDDPDVLGMVGPPSLQAARALLPVANNADLAVVSPTLTDDCLTTVRLYCTHGQPNSLRPNNAQPGQPGDLTFFRIPALTSTQGTAAADFIIDTLNKTSVFLVKDATSLGLHLTDTFSGTVQTKGATIVGTADVDSTQSVDTRALAAEIRHASPEVVMFASDSAAMATSLGAALSGTATTLIVPDALRTPEMAAAAAGWNGVTLMATALASDPATRGAAFRTAWLARRHSEPPPYALETWLATRALIEAIRHGIDGLAGQQIDALPTADTVRTSLTGTALPTDDLVGVSFGATGDDNSQLVTLMRAGQGRWAVVDHVQAPS